MQISRYEELESINTNLDPLTDLVTWLEYYCATDYLVLLLTTRHGVATASAKTRAQLIRPHARLATEYIDQALSGPSDVAFLPIYYAILNLLKIYILFGAHYAQLPANRWHGAKYDGYDKASHTLLTEKITVKKGGTIPLFYQTITGQPVRRDTPFCLSEIYPYLWDISTEYQMASGYPPKIVELVFGKTKVGNQERLQATVFPHPGAAVPTPRELKALVGFQKNPTEPKILFSKPLVGTPPNIRDHLKPYLFVPAHGWQARLPSFKLTFRFSRGISDSSRFLSFVVRRAIQTRISHQIKGFQILGSTVDGSPALSPEVSADVLVLYSQKDSHHKLDGRSSLLEALPKITCAASLAELEGLSWSAALR